MTGKRGKLVVPKRIAIIRGKIRRLCSRFLWSGPQIVNVDLRNGVKWGMSAKATIHRGKDGHD